MPMRPMNGNKAFMSCKLYSLAEKPMQDLPVSVVISAFPLRRPANTFIHNLYLFTSIDLFPKHTVPCENDIRIYDLCASRVTPSVYPLYAHAGKCNIT